MSDLCREFGHLERMISSWSAEGAVHQASVCDTCGAEFHRIFDIKTGETTGMSVTYPPGYIREDWAELPWPHRKERREQ